MVDMCHIGLTGVGDTIDGDGVIAMIVVGPWADEADIMERRTVPGWFTAGGGLVTMDPATDWVSACIACTETVGGTLECGGEA